MLLTSRAIKSTDNLVMCMKGNERLKIMPVKILFLKVKGKTFLRARKE